MITPVAALERWTYGATHWVELADRKPKLLATLGVAMLAMIVAVAAVVLMSFAGEFTTYSLIHADLPAQGSAVALNSPVEYRDVTVGKVATSAKNGPGGLVSVVLHLQPNRLKSIPANVTATVAPISIFGNQYVVLVPPARPVGTLGDDQTVPALSQGPTSTLQYTLANLDNLLVQIHPAQLFSALSALANALQGQGQSLGATLVSFNGYLRNMDPLWAQAVADFNLLSPVANQVAASTPNLVGTLANLSTTSATINTDQSSLDQLLAGGTTFANLTTTLLTNIQQPYAELVTAAGPFLHSLSQTPTTISEILAGLNSWATTWVAAEANGPYLTLTAAPIVVQNAADLALGVLGGPDVTNLFSQALGPGVVNPTTYTAADCPRYGSLAGPNCSGGSTAGTATSTARAILDGLGPVRILPEPQQQQAAATITAGLNGGVSPLSSSVASLLLSPVLTHLAGSP